jgi:hypothetical protein
MKNISKIHNIENKHNTNKAAKKTTFFLLQVIDFTQKMTLIYQRGKINTPLRILDDNIKQ